MTVWRRTQEGRHGGRSSPCLPADGRIIIGQNPASGRVVDDLLNKALNGQQPIATEGHVADAAGKVDRVGEAEQLRRKPLLSARQ